MPYSLQKTPSRLFCLASPHVPQVASLILLSPPSGRPRCGSPPPARRPHPAAPRSGCRRSGGTAAGAPARSFFLLYGKVRGLASDFFGRLTGWNHSIRLSFSFRMVLPGTSSCLSPPVAESCLRAAGLIPFIHLKRADCLILQTDRPVRSASCIHP